MTNKERPDKIARPDHNYPFDNVRTLLLTDIGGGWREVPRR